MFKIGNVISFIHSLKNQIKVASQVEGRLFKPRLTAQSFRNSLEKLHLKVTASFTVKKNIANLHKPP